MLKISDLNVGDKVYYQPGHYDSDRFENGIIKEIPCFAADAGHAHYNSVRVVYNCAGDWDNYADYTSALTHLRDLKLGWK